MGRGLMTLVSIVSKKDKNLQGQKESTRKCRISSVQGGIICCCGCTSTYIRYHGGLFVFEMNNHRIRGVCYALSGSAFLALF